MEEIRIYNESLGIDGTISQLDEVITWGGAIGALLVIGGMLLGSLNKRKAQIDSIEDRNDDIQST